MTDMPKTIAAIRETHDTVSSGYWTDAGDEYGNATEYRRADLRPTREQIEAMVVPLAWGGFCAPGYWIEVRDSGIANLFCALDRDEDGDIEPMQGGFLTLFSIEAAKAAAQADHTRRILAALGYEVE